MGLPLFCYGTLAVPGMLQAIAGALPRWEAAVLPGYRCLLLQGRSYPGIFPADASTSGILYANPGPAAMARLDRYEGPEYRRRRVAVRRGRQRVLAWAYVPQPGRARPSTVAWDPERFRRAYLAGRGPGTQR